MIDPTALLQFPGWIRNAMESGRSATELARLLGTTPAAIAELVSSVPTRPADVRRLVAAATLVATSRVAYAEARAAFSNRRRMT